MTRVAGFVATALLALTLVGLTVSYLQDGLIAQLLAAEMTSTSRLELLREWVASFGAWSGLVYVALVTVEVVVAPLPGPLLYAPAGYLFGTFLGGTLALLGNLLGAYLAYSLARLWGEELSLNLSEDLVERLSARGFLLVFLLRLNPLTSSDLVSYAAGLARLPAAQVVLATGLALTPSCYLYAWLAQAIFTRYPTLFVVTAVVLTLALLVLAVGIFRSGRADSGR